MSDFDFPIQSAPAAAMPFEPLTGNSRRSDMTVRYLSFSANFHSDINDNKSKWFYLQQVTGKSAADKWLGKENSSHAHSNFTSRAKPTPCTPEHQVKPIRVIKPGSTRDDLPTLAELLAWKNPPASFCSLVFGAAVCGAASFAFSRQAPFLSSAVPWLSALSMRRRHVHYIPVEYLALVRKSCIINEECLAKASHTPTPLWCRRIYIFSVSAGSQFRAEHVLGFVAQELSLVRVRVRRAPHTSLQRLHFVPHACQGRAHVL